MKRTKLLKKSKPGKLGKEQKLSRTFFAANFALIIKKSEKSKNYFYCSYKLSNT
jgi:hypothetical protein